MAFHLKRNLVICFTLLVILQLAMTQDDQPTGSEDEDDSSSEETVEDSQETTKRRRRSAEFAEDPVTKSQELNAKSNRAIPGLPDPATILKIAEILTTVGQDVLPILVQGNSFSNFVTDRIARDMQFAGKFKNDIDMLAHNLKRK